MHQRPTEFDKIKSIVRNTLLASPDFPRLYADLLTSQGYNPKHAMNLAVRYQKKFGANMPAHTNVKTCTHIKVTGVRCGSPALRGEDFCYFHQRMLRTVKAPNSRLHHVALLENEEAIQASLMEVVNALIRGTIDLKRGELILRALNAAVRNSRRTRFNVDSTQMVKQLPNFDSDHEPITVATGLHYDATQRKPPLGVKTDLAPAGANAAAPKERKITAHAVRRG